MKPLKRVAQRDWEQGDCGLACVAMVAGVPYETVLSVFRKLDKNGTAENLYTRHKQIQDMLDALGVATKRVKFKSWKDIQNHAIVKVNLRKSGNWHWVVFDAGRALPAVHDPRPGRKKIVNDFRGLKGSGFYIALA